MPVEGGVVGFVDVPGHERLVHNMLAGASGIDFALLVVAADDGVMPQTREHLAILDLLGLTRGVVALSKADLVDADRLAAAEAEVANALIGTGIEGAEVLAVSSATGAGVEALRARLAAAARATLAKPADAPFRLAVDRSFTLPGSGTVVTGTVLAGSVAAGDRLVVSPSGLQVRIRGLHAQNRKAGRGGPGDRCALNLAGEGVAKDAVRRGDMVLDAGLHAPCDRIDARLRVLASETRPVTQWLPVHLHHGSAEVPARVVLLDGPLAPGEEGFVQLVLERPIAAVAGDRFVIRDTSAQRTLGGGVLLDLRAPARRRRTPERIAQLEAHAVADPEAALGALLARPPHQLDPDGFARDRGLSPAAFAAIAERAAVVRVDARGGAVGMARPTWERLERAILAALEAFHADNPDLAGIGMERLRGGLEPRLPAPAFAAVLQVHARAGRIALDGAWVRLAGHEVRLAPGDEIALGGDGADDRRRGALPPAAGARPRGPARPARGRGAPPLQAGRPHGPRARGRPRPLLPARHRRRDGRHRRRAGRRARALQRGAVPRPAGQRPQGGDPDSGVPRPPRRDNAPGRPAPDQPAPARPVPARHRWRGEPEPEGIGRTAQG